MPGKFWKSVRIFFCSIASWFGPSFEISKFSRIQTVASSCVSWCFGGEGKFCSRASEAQHRPKKSKKVGLCKAGSHKVRVCRLCAVGQREFHRDQCEQRDTINVSNVTGLSLALIPPDSEGNSPWKGIGS